MNPLIKEARRLGCCDPLVTDLADYAEKLEAALLEISQSVSLHHCQRTAREALKGD